MTIALMTIKAVFVPAAVALSLVTSAHAASVTNRDSQDHTITVVEGDTKKDHVLKPNAVLTGICEKGCIVRLSGRDEDPYELESSDVTSIEGGLLYDDGQGPSVVPDAASPGQKAPGSSP
jgi:hypothetical protein